MSTVFSIIEVVIAVVLYLTLKKYIDWLIALITSFLPSSILAFITLGITVSILLFIIDRKNGSD